MDQSIVTGQGETKQVITSLLSAIMSHNLRHPHQAQRQAAKGMWRTREEWEHIPLNLIMMPVGQENGDLTSALFGVLD